MDRYTRQHQLAQFGEIHPAVLEELDIKGPLVGFEAVMDAIPQPKAGLYRKQEAAWFLMVKAVLVNIYRTFAVHMQCV